MDATAVYVRHDARRLPLQRPYDGPFAVLDRGPKAFKLNINGTTKSISVDRLKPAQASCLLPSVPGPPRAASAPAPVPDPGPNLDPDPEAPLPRSTTTRSGRISRPPDRF